MKSSIHWESSVSSTTPVKTMARLLCFALIIAASVLMCVLAQELYSDQYDYVDMKAVFDNKDMRDAYYNCFMDRTKCQSEEQKFAAGIFSEAYTTNCSKCTEKQKEDLKMIVDWYTNNDTDKWKLALEKIQEEMKAN